MSPQISILLPVYNAETTLPTTLRSISRQRMEDWECLVMDDGSADRSLEIARAAADHDPRFKIFPGAHLGLIPTLNAGIAHARGEYVARMDADDWMHRDRLAEQFALLTAHPELDAAGCFVRIFPRASMRDGRRRYEEWLHSLTDPETLWLNRFIECPVAHPTLMIRKRAFHDSGYHDEGWPEDYDLMLRLLRKGPCIGMVPRRLLGWRDQPRRLSRTDERYALAEFGRCRAFFLSQDFLANHSTYALWGHGRTGRALRKALAGHGHTVSTIVEVHPRRIGQRIHGAPVIHPDALPSHPREPLIVSVSGAKPRAEIRTALADKGYREGLDFVCAA
ncbi:MAG: glycosyltransferase family 2 protein [Myxococcota bacterium]